MQQATLLSLHHSIDVQLGGQVIVLQFANVHIHAHEGGLRSMLCAEALGCLPKAGIEL